MAGLKAIAQYEAMRRLIDAGKSVEDAKKQVAKETGISASTIHTAYYRVARETGVLKPRGGRGSKSTNRQRGNGNVTTAVLLERVVEATNALALRMERDERELANLRQIRDLARQS